MTADKRAEIRTRSRDTELSEVLNVCHCVDAYKLRGLVQPDCCRCHGEDELNEKLDERDKILDALDAAEAKLSHNRCNSGHETLPLVLWDCPECGRLREEKLRAEVERLKRQVAVLTEALEGYARRQAWASFDGVCQDVFKRGKDGWEYAEQALAEARRIAEEP